MDSIEVQQMKAQAKEEKARKKVSLCCWRTFLAYRLGVLNVAVSRLT